MDTMIEICVIAPAEVDQEAFYEPPPPQDVKFQGAAGRYFSH